MSFSFSSVGHFLASALSDVVKGADAVASFLAKAVTPANQTEIEALTALLPGAAGVTGVAIERGVFAVAGEVASVIHTFDTAAIQKLADAGLDKDVITEFADLIKSVPGLFASVKSAPIAK